jgi:hypothetical protein
MRRISILFVVLGLISLSFVSSPRAQRALGAHALILDDGAGNTLTLAYPNSPFVSGNSTFSFPSGCGSATPCGTTNNSTLRWNFATSTWQEDVNVLATSGGALTAASLAVTGGTITAPSSGGGAGTVLALTSGSSGGASNGANALLTAGNATGSGQGGAAFLVGGNSGSGQQGGLAQVQGGSPSGGNALGGTAAMLGGTGSGTQPGGFASVQGGYGQATTTGGGGSVVLQGGFAGSATGTGGSIILQTSLHNEPTNIRMTVTNAGLVQIGSSNQFQVDQSGNIVTTGNLSARAIAGNVTTGVSLASSQYLVTSTDMTIIVVTGGGSSFVLPSPSTAGRILIVKNTDPAHVVNIIEPAGYVDGLNTFTLQALGTSPFGCVLVGDGTNNWWVVGTR